MPCCGTVSRDIYMKLSEPFKISSVTNFLGKNSPIWKNGPKLLQVKFIPTKTLWKYHQPVNNSHFDNFWMLKPQIYQHFTCPKSNNSFGPYYKILPHCFRAQLSEIIILTKYNNLYENLHAKSNRCLCRRGKPDGIGLNWIFTKRCLFYFTYIFLWPIVSSLSVGLYDILAS